MSSPKAPVALIGFNRPETVRRVFAAVREARPERLFLIADGPRAGRPGEAERCAEVRRAMTAVDWPCTVETNFAAENMGCRQRIVSGLNWVFEHVEEAIILEDDCLPDQSFFAFCAELLERYRERPEVAYITGFNPLEQEFPIPWSYSFSRLGGIWGWATWRRAWSAYDGELRDWPEVKAGGCIERLFPEPRVSAYWTWVFDRMHAGTGPDTWDYQWSYTCWMRNWLAVVPGRNLVENIGAGEDATHTTRIDPAFLLRAQAMEMPLRHPPAMTAWPQFEKRMQDRFFAQTLRARVLRILQRLAGRG